MEMEKTIKVKVYYTNEEGLINIDEDSMRDEFEAKMEDLMDTITDKPEVVELPNGKRAKVI